jgi:hypothetical protein
MRTSWSPTWSSVRAIGNSVYVRLTVLIPLIGYLIIFNANVVHYLQLAKEFVGLQNQPESAVSTRLLLIYFGLTSLAGGSAIYSLFCPWQVRHYGTSAAYVGGEREHIGDFGMEEIEDLLRNSKYQDRYKRIRDRYERIGGPPLGPEQKAEVDKGILHLHFKHLDSSFPTARWLAFVTFVIGLACLAIPSATVFWTVCSILVSRVW